MCRKLARRLAVVGVKFEGKICERTTNQCLMKFMMLLLSCLSSSLLVAQFTYSGVLHQTEAELLYAEEQTWDSLLHTETQMVAKGFRLMDLETAKENGNRSFWSIWVKSELGQRMEKVNGWATFIKAKRAQVKEGYVMAEVEGYALTEEEQQFVGVWHKGDTPHKVWRLDSQEGIMKKTQEMADLNFYLVDLDVFQTPSGTAQYLALYHYGAVGKKAYIVVEKDLKLFNTELLRRTKSGYRIIDFEKYEENEQVFYLAVFRKGLYEAVLLRDLDKDGFDGRLDMSEQNRFQLIDLEVDNRPGGGKLTVKK